jgi:toxin ParE1/3/4
MAFKVIWTETAYEDLKGIVRYISIDNPDAAARLAKRMITHIELASEYPFSNRIVPEKGDETIREVLLKPYRIIYVIDDAQKTISVLRVWHGYRGTPSI